MIVMSSSAPSTIPTISNTSCQSDNSEIQEKRGECNCRYSAQIKHKVFNAKLLHSVLLLSPPTGWILTFTTVKSRITKRTADREEDKKVLQQSSDNMQCYTLKGFFLWHSLYAFVIHELSATWTSD